MNINRKEALLSFRVCVAFSILVLSIKATVTYAQTEIEVKTEIAEVNTVDCAHDKEFSKALGMVVGHEVMKEHYKLIDPEIFMKALFSQMYEGAKLADKRHFELKDTSVSTENYDGIETAITILKQWPEKTSVEKSSSSFISAYKNAYKSDVSSTKSGLIYRVVGRDNHTTKVGKGDTNILHDMVTMCQDLQNDNLEVDAERDGQTICFQRQRIERQTACEIQEGQRTRIVPDTEEIQLDQFPRKYFGLVAHNMIVGWAEALEILNRYRDDTGTTPVLEVVIPSELAYQNDYVSDSVRPGEALWFLLTSIDNVIDN